MNDCDHDWDSDILGDTRFVHSISSRPPSHTAASHNLSWSSASPPTVHTDNLSCAWILQFRQWGKSDVDRHGTGTASYHRLFFPAVPTVYESMKWECKEALLPSHLVRSDEYKRSEALGIMFVCLFIYFPPFPHTKGLKAANNEA